MAQYDALGFPLSEGIPKPADRPHGWRGPKGPQPGNTSGFHATGHRVLMLGEQKQEKSTGGIILPEKTAKAGQDQQVWATVVEVGWDAWSDKSTDYAAVGDRVLVGMFMGKFHVSEVDGKTYRFVQDLDVISPFSGPNTNL